MKRFLLLTLFNIFFFSLFADSIVLDRGWEFKQARLDNWHPATVPGTVHTDLMACGLIDDPFDALNERAVQWVDKEDWEYRTTFDAPASALGNGTKNASHELVFHGLDTYADVYLNDSLILEADNMFRTWRVDVTALLKSSNSLRIYFHSPIKRDVEKWNSLPQKYHAINDQSENGGIFDRRVSVFARKAGYHYGWDWGPRLVTSGIWRPIELVTNAGVLIDDVYTRQQTTAKLARLSQTVAINSTGDRQAVVSVCLKDTDKPLASKRVDLKAGRNEVTLDFQIKNPRLWWTNGLGEPHLYTFTTAVETDEQRIVEDQRIGLRSLRVLAEKDAEGREFCFELNGERVFMKGADYIPCDNFLPRVTDSIYRETIRSAVDVNMNMIRVWGGGVYEDDRFYDLCDENGLLVWQDFMFACSLYPASGALLDNIREEARDNIVRLRNHPCIALWCGNNECQDAYYGWGWREGYFKQSPEIGKRVQEEFENLYFKALPELVAQLDPDVRYWPSSPSPYGVMDGNGPRESSNTKNGDFHYWGVWHGGEPVSNYNVHRARFYSEYGMQSFPEFESVKTFCPDPQQWDIHSDVMMAHQRGGSFANSRIEGYLENEYVKPDDFADLLYVGQLMQGDAMKTAVEAHRRDKGHCWGTLIWQINDCWPVASWSTRDYYGRWKAAHYMVRHAMDDILVSPIRTHQCLSDEELKTQGNAAHPDRLEVYIVNDRRENVNGTLSISLCTMKGEVLRSEQKTVTLPANSSLSHYSADVATFLDGRSMADVYVTADFTPDAKSLSRSAAKTGGGLPLKSVYASTYCMLKPREMHFPEAHISKDFGIAADGTPTVTLTADAFVRGVFLSIPGVVNPFADNYLDLRPGQSVTIGVRNGVASSQLSSRLVLNSLNALGK